MSCAYRLHGRARLTLFESEMEPGGHTHTVDAVENGRPVPVDTGFMVYNEVTYPLLTRLFRELEVETVETDMSFGVQHRPTGVEYCGSSLNQVFARRSSLFRPAFWGMLQDILRFNRTAVAALQDPLLATRTLRQFVQEHRFGPAFLHQYLVPMTSAIWSTPPDAMLEFPAHSLLRFMFNHGLLGVNTQHQWRTVVGGSRSYRNKLIAPFRDCIRCHNPVAAVHRLEDGVEVVAADGSRHRFDKAVLATHADTSCRLLQDASPGEREVLSAFRYAANTITLHTDESVMPRSRRAWASWNYRVDALADGRHQASTHYWMNSLQHLDTKGHYFVSVNEPGLVDRSRVLREFTFDHPMFDQATARAQARLPELNENRRIYFCGSYFRYGFHEDGLMSGYEAAARVLAHHASDAQLAV